MVSFLVAGPSTLSLYTPGVAGAFHCQAREERVVSTPFDAVAV
jgi:hypothetical protein